MPHRLIASIVTPVAMLIFSAVVLAQASRPEQSRAPNRQTGAAPRRDLSGIWDAGGAGVHPLGFSHLRPALTLLGEKMFRANKPGRGITEVPVGLTNDPLDSCDPAGFPRSNLFELRAVQVVQTSNQVLLLYEYQRVWRVIWTDGRALPKDPDPTLYGYSVGKWVDDTTFVAETVGLEEKTWLDNSGDPHSSDLRVEERFHRVDRDTLDLTVTIDDPKVYTKSWVAGDKVSLKLQPPDREIKEMFCVPTEMEAYKKLMANPAAGKK
jgi:hypothetical protein